MINNTNKIMLITIFTVCVIFSMYSPSQASLSSVDLQQMYSDPNEGYTNDLQGLWMGKDNDNLYFVVDYYKLVDNTDIGASVNITLRDRNFNYYLIQVGYFNASYFVSITEGSNLFSPEAANNSSFSISYGTQQVYFNPYKLELGFFIKWIDVGGIGEVDCVIWTSMFVDTQINATTESSSDLIPNSGYVVFSSVNNIDRQVDFTSALAGVYETSSTDSITSTGQGSSQIQEQLTPVVETSQGTPTDNSWTISVVFVVLLIVVFIIIYNSNKFKKSIPRPMAKDLAKFEPKPAFKRPIQVPARNVEMKFIPELNREVRMCCFQTARLNETYCYCGRAVDPDIKALFEVND